MRGSRLDFDELAGLDENRRKAQVTVDNLRAAKNKSAERFGRMKKDGDVPYRALVPKQIDGLLATGKSSVPYGPNFRGRPYMFLNGQAAGVAAALCARDGVQPRDLDVKKLQRILVSELDCPLADADRLKELGLA